MAPAVLPDRRSQSTSDAVCLEALDFALRIQHATADTEVARTTAGLAPFFKGSATEPPALRQLGLRQVWLVGRAP